MEYQALYRRYRPQTFDDVIGQSHVTSTLAREVAGGHVAHAYLFAGPRGTGKTTTARILAKALNCENRLADGSPDNTCDSCLAITEGSSLDVMELDAASHNSVDDIREMRVSVTTVASTADARRIFILDEAHMLSKAAGNALLKTLEEPPPGVHFVLATTEPYKLLDTIRSRAQRFDFHAIAIETLAAHLGRIGDREGVKTDPSALVAVARHAKGSARDALSLLEQVAALGDGKVDVKGVLRALGLADADAYGMLATAIGEGDAKSALELVARLSSEGVDLRRFVSEAVAFFRGVFLAHYAPNLAEITDESEQVLTSWRNTAKALTPGEVLRSVDVLGEALIKLREGREERLMLELAMIKLTRPETSIDAEALTARMDRLERRLAANPVKTPDHQSEPTTHVGASGPDRPEPGSGSADRQDSDRQPSPQTETQNEAASPHADAATEPVGEHGGDPDPGDGSNGGVQTGGPSNRSQSDGAGAGVTFSQFEDIWPRLFEGLRDVLGSRRWALFRETRAGDVSGNALLVDVRYDFHLQSLQEDDVVSRVVATRASDLLGFPVDVVFRLVGEGGLPVSDEAVDAESESETDASRLLEAPSDVADPLKLMTDELGARIVDEFEAEDG